MNLPVEGELEIFAHKPAIDFVRNEVVQLYACTKRYSPSYSMQVAHDLVLVEHKEGSPARPFAEISTRAAQHLMDQLWACGLRPVEGAGSAGSLAATERHLADMRRLVFDGRQGVRDEAR